MAKRKNIKQAPGDEKANPLAALMGKSKGKGKKSGRGKAPKGMLKGKKGKKARSAKGPRVKKNYRVS